MTALVCIAAVFAVLLGLLALVLWLTGEGGPCDPLAFWDEPHE